MKSKISVTQIIIIIIAVIGSIFIAHYEDFLPYSWQTYVESARDGSLRNVQGRLVTQNQLTVQGFPGLQFQAHARSNSVMDSRIVMVDKRLYMIMGVAPAGRAEPKVVQRMFDSFKLNPK